MHATLDREALLRPRGDGQASVRPVELFFDLVYVLAVTQLTHHLLTHLTWRGAAETLVLLLVVWLGWIHITWLSNYFDVRVRFVRLFVLAMMAASLISSASIPEAFDARGIAFAAGFTAIYLGGCAFALTVVGRGHRLAPAFERVTIWACVITPLYLIGGLVEGDGRFVIWAATTALIYVVMWLGFPVPRLGHSHTTDYTIAGEHMAERCLLFITLALGESIIITGTEFGELPGTIERCAAFFIAFIGSVAIWWIYFDRAAEAGSRVISESEDPGRLGLVAYTYIHIPMVAGIIVVAAGDEVAIAHPLDEVSFAEAAVIIGGPALYLAGNTLFKIFVWGHVPASRVAGFIVLAALIPVAVVASALVLTAATAAALVGVAAYDLLTERRYLAELDAAQPAGGQHAQEVERTRHPRPVGPHGYSDGG